KHPVGRETAAERARRDLRLDVHGLEATKVRVPRSVSGIAGGDLVRDALRRRRAREGPFDLLGHPLDRMELAVEGAAAGQRVRDVKRLELIARDTEAPKCGHVEPTDRAMAHAEV